MTSSLLSYTNLDGPFGVLGISFLIGALGAGCYFTGVYFGFINASQRFDILRYMLEAPIRSIVIFCILGGVVAAIFQMAQLDTLVPIQAFVLGATWPSVVNRMLTGTGSDSVRSFVTSPIIVPKPLDASAKPKEIPLD